jgi:ABC-type uncharacterized transport system permease subunit
MIQDLFSVTVLIGILASGIRLATPYLYAAIGETFGQKSGVLNLGVEGQMLLGAFAAFYVSLKTGNLWLGLLTAMLVGAVMGLAMAYVTVNLQAQQGISGIGFYLFGLGMSDLLFQKLMPTVETIRGFPKIYIPGLSDIPGIGEIFFSQNILVYGAYLLVPVAWFVLNKTTLGSEDPIGGREPGCSGFTGGECRAHPLLHHHPGRDTFGNRRRFAVHCAVECFPAEHDQRSGLHRGGAGVFWRMASHWRAWRRVIVQHGQRIAVVGAGVEHPDRT